MFFEEGQRLLVLGEEPTYLVKLGAPGGHPRHQSIARVTLSHGHVEVRALRRQDQRVTGEKVYTLVLRRGALITPLEAKGQDMKGSMANGRSVTADLYRGHVDQGGTLLLKNIAVSVEEALLAWDVSQTGSVVGSYYLFGDQRELFAMRLKEAPEESDQILRVRIREGVADGSLAKRIGDGIRATFIEQGSRPDLPASATRLGMATLAESSLPLVIEIIDEVYSDR